jgi:peptidoglycan/LPS O-acetylase OafA/YrhL
MSQADRNYRPDIDGLRAVAVGVVLVYHAFPSVLPGGFVGVDVFFVISGYLISGIILAAIGDGRFTFSNFYARRIRRIFPALAVVLAAVLVAGWFLLYATEYARAARQAVAGAAFFANIAAWREASYFDVAADLKPLLHLWSLGVEEQFYFVWPLLLVVAARWRRGPVAVTLAIGAISFALAIWTVRIDRTPAFYAPWNRFWELLAGALLACIEADAVLRAAMTRLVSRQWLSDAASVAGLSAIAAGVWLIDSTRVFPGLWVLLPVGGSALMIAAGARAVANRVILAHPVAVWIGLISYPLYLWHWPLLAFARIRSSGVPPASLRLGLLALSVILAWATYRLIERPLRFGARTRAAVPALAVAMSIICAAGAAIFMDDGVFTRPINRNSGAKLVDYYDRMHKDLLADAYRLECDFMDADNEQVRDSLAADCTAPGRDHTVMLWGDSYAQALSLGLRESLPPNTALAQVATSACNADIDDFDLAVRDRRCEKTNLFAMQAIERLRPDIVVIAQAGGHDDTDWEAITARALALGAKHVIVVGPSPLWQPTLPRIYGERHMEDRAEYVGEGLDAGIFETDRALAARVAKLANVTYVSLLGELCRQPQRDCLARVPGEDELDLMAVDFGHLSPKGSSYLGRKIWKPLLERLIR